MKPKLKKAEAQLPIANAVPTALQHVLTLVIGERLRQNELVQSGRFPFNCASREIGHLAKLPILAEEHGEVGKALYELTLAVRTAYPNAGEITRCTTNLHTELIQVAAVALAWAESLTPP